MLGMGSRHVDLPGSLMWLVQLFVVRSTIQECCTRQESIAMSQFPSAEVTGDSASELRLELVAFLLKMRNCFGDQAQQKP